MAIIRRTFRQSNFGNGGAVHISGRVEIGAAGAVGAKVGKLFNVTRASAGTYNITLDAANGLLGYFNASASVVGPTNLTVKIASVNISTGVMQVVCLQAADGTTATDPASGSSLCFSLEVKNANV